MGFLDVINGMRNGPRGGATPQAGGGGMSPITMAILAYLAYKGIKHVSGGQQPAPSGNPQIPSGGRPMEADASSGGGLGDILGGLLGGGRGAAPAGGGGGIGDLLKGGLGGLLAGGAAGSVLSGGLGDLLKQFQQNGQAETAQSWVSRGPNKDISESDLARSIGAEDIEALSRHTGLSREDLLAGLRRELPGAVDELTPEGRLPTQEEASRWV